MSVRFSPPPQDAATWMGALARVMARVTANADRDGVIGALAVGLADEFNVDVARLWLYDPTCDVLRLRARAGPTLYELGPFDQIALDDLRMPIVRAIRSGGRLVFDPIQPTDVFTHPELIRAAGLRSFAGFPLVVGDRLVGGMSMFLHAPWPPSMLEALGVLAQQAALALDHARLLEETHTLQGVAAELATARDTQALLDGLVERTTTAFGANGCAMFLLNDAQTRLVAAAEYGVAAPIMRFMTGLDLAGQGMEGAFRRYRTPVFHRDLVGECRANARWQGFCAALEAEGIVCALRLPVVQPGGEVVGVLVLYHTRARAYSATEIRLAQAFANQMAVAIHNARLAEQEGAARAAADRQLERLTALAGIAEQLLASSDLGAVLRVVVDAVVRLCGARGAVVALIDASGQRLTPMAAHGDLPAWFDAFRDTPIDEELLSSAVTGEALSRLETVIVADYATAPAVRDHDQRIAAGGMRSFIAAPLRKGDLSLGVLWAAHTEADAFTAEDAALMQALADQAALALEQARLIEESHALQVVAAEIASTRDTGTLLREIVQRSMAALGADACAIWLLDEAAGVLLPGAAAGVSQRFLDRVGLMEGNASAAQAALAGGRSPSYFRDAPAALRPRWPALADALVEEGITSMLRMPLHQPDGRVDGVVLLYHHRERLYSDNEIRLAQAFTDQAAVALYNARLSGNERAARDEATRQLERLRTLTRITERLLASTDLDDVLGIVVDAGWRLCNATGAMVGLIDEAGERLMPLATTGEPRAYFADIPVAVMDAEFRAGTVAGQAIARGEPLTVADYRAWPQPSPSQQATVAAGVRAVIAAPLRLDGTPIGMLWVNDTRPRTFAPEDVALVQALADQAALAVEHARLLQRGQEASALEERARLARDLHDSVTQSVFSLGMLARAAQTQHERGSDKLGPTLARIGTLSEDALKEMRALLVQLRPPGLDKGLVAALEQLVASFRVRSDVLFGFDAPAVCPLAPAVEAAVFRIVQEALGNAVKHAAASEVHVALVVAADALTATVRDNGVGFDAEAPTRSEGGIGLHSMRERAAEAGAVLHIASVRGAGSTITVTAPLLGGRE